jgi:hypothetical protein
MSTQYEDRLFGPKCFESVDELAAAVFLLADLLGVYFVRTDLPKGQGSTIEMRDDR